MGNLCYQLLFNFVIGFILKYGKFDVDCFLAEIIEIQNQTYTGSDEARAPRTVGVEGGGEALLAEVELVVAVAEVGLIREVAVGEVTAVVFLGPPSRC